MSLFGAIRVAANTLRADEIALQVASQNIANANTPGYIREEVVLSPAPTQRIGSLVMGLGVQVDAIVQKLDKFLEERLRGAVSEQSSAETLQQTYGQLEGFISALSDTNLSTSMSNFFQSISEILNQPEDIAVRNLAVLQGKTLAQDITRMADRTAQFRRDMNDRVANMADDINRLVGEVRVLNLQIVETEGGSVSKTEAVGLRDRRLLALENLAKLIDIRVAEQPNGSVAVYAGGDFLVFEGTSRRVDVTYSTDRGLPVADIRLVSTDAPLQPAAGELRGLLRSRDDVLGGFLDRLDDFAATLALEFNRLYSSGQGLNGYQQLTSTYQVVDADAPLSAAGLKFTPHSGAFQVLVHDKNTGLTKTTDIPVTLAAADQDTTLTQLRDQLNAVDGLHAQISADGKLTLSSTSADKQFAFANDTSNVLVALGLNTFFTGSTARDLGINEAVQEDPATFAASREGIGVDTKVAQDLAQFLDRPLDSQNGASIAVLYDRFTAETTQGSTVARSAADGARSFQVTLRGQKFATSGVNLDEEAVRMIAYQRSYQASARYLATLNDLFGVLVNL